MSHASCQKYGGVKPVLLAKYPRNYVVYRKRNNFNQYSLAAPTKCDTLHTTNLRYASPLFSHISVYNIIPPPPHRSTSANHLIWIFTLARMGWPFTDQIACLVEWLFVLLSLNGDGWSLLDARSGGIRNDDEASDDDNDRSAVNAGDASNAARHENVIVVPLFTTCSRGASITVPENGVSINWGSVCVRRGWWVFPSVYTFFEGGLLMLLNRVVCGRPPVHVEWEMNKCLWV